MLSNKRFEIRSPLIQIQIKINKTNNNWCRCHFSSLQWYFTIKPSQINIPNLALLSIILSIDFPKLVVIQNPKFLLVRLLNSFLKWVCCVGTMEGFRVENPTQLVLFSLVFLIRSAPLFVERKSSYFLLKQNFVCMRFIRRSI